MHIVILPLLLSISLMLPSTLHSAAAGTPVEEAKATLESIVNYNIYVHNPAGARRFEQILAKHPELILHEWEKNGQLKGPVISFAKLEQTDSPYFDTLMKTGHLDLHKPMRIEKSREQKSLIEYFATDNTLLNTPGMQKEFLKVICGAVKNHREIELLLDENFRKTKLLFAGNNSSSWGMPDLVTTITSAYYKLKKSLKSEEEIALAYRAKSLQTNEMLLSKIEEKYPLPLEIHLTVLSFAELNSYDMWFMKRARSQNSHGASAASSSEKA